MRTIYNISLLVFLSGLFVAPAYAGTTTITVLDASSVSHSYTVVTDGSGNYIGKGVICDQSAGANCATVDSSHNLQVSQPTAANFNATVVQATAANLNATVAQATAANLNATVVGTGTFAVQATLQASATTAIGKVDPNTIGSWGLQVSTQNSATPTNGGLVLGQFNTSPTTITSGNVSPLQMDSAGNLLVNIKAGAGSGGTAIADNAAFTQGTTNETPLGCLFTNSYSAATSGHSTIASCTSGGSLNVNVTNASTPGQAVMASSNPVVIASNQSAIPVNLQASIAGSQTGLVSCASHFTTHITSATDVVLVQGVTSQTVKICGYKASFSGSAAQSGYIENTASINNNCSSTLTQITGLDTGNSSAPSYVGFYNSIWGGLANTSGNGVCYHTTGTGGVDVDIWYTQGS